MKLLKKLAISLSLCAAVISSSAAAVTANAAEAYTVQCQQMLTLINKYRADAGVAPLELYIPACSAAQIRAEELTKEYPKNFSHNRPNGSSFETILDSCRISSFSAGENIAASSGEWTVVGVMDAWMNSEGHRNNILSPNYKYLGIGIVNGMYWEQLFIGSITTTPSALGDVNGDGQIDAVDASNVLDYYAYNAVADCFVHNNDFKKSADVDKNGSIDSLDASRILKYYADKATGKNPTL